MKNIQKTIANTLAITAIAMLFFFALIFILFNFLKVGAPIKDAWETLGSYFGGITTLVTAYVAMKLYDDWRSPHNLNIETEHKKDILKIIRKIQPLEYRYNRLLSNHFIYKCSPERTIAVNIKSDELTQLTEYINELLALLDELYLITKDEKIKNLLSHYYNYAQLYTFILGKANSLYEKEDKAEFIEFLRTSLTFDFVDIENQKSKSSLLYAYAFSGIEKSKMRKYISENLKTSNE